MVRKSIINSCVQLYYIVVQYKGICLDVRFTLDLLERARVAQQIEEDRTRRDAKVKGEQVEEEYQGEIVEFKVTKFEYDKSAVLPVEC